MDQAVIIFNNGIRIRKAVFQDNKTIYPEEALNPDQFRSGSL